MAAAILSVIHPSITCDTCDTCLMPAKYHHALFALIHRNWNVFVPKHSEKH